MHGEPVVATVERPTAYDGNCVARAGLSWTRSQKVMVDANMVYELGVWLRGTGKQLDNYGRRGAAVTKRFPRSLGTGARCARLSRKPTRREDEIS